MLDSLVAIIGFALGAVAVLCLASGVAVAFGD
jgi:hypothetical protein